MSVSDYLHIRGSEYLPADTYTDAVTGFTDTDSPLPLFSGFAIENSLQLKPPQNKIICLMVGLPEWDHCVRKVG